MDVCHHSTSTITITRTCPNPATIPVYKYIYVLEEARRGHNVVVFNSGEHHGLRYIGSTIHPGKRLANHKSHYKKYLTDAKLRCNSLYVFQKYGVDNVEMRILEKVPLEMTSEREIFHINSQPTGICVNSRNKLFSQ